MSRPAKVINDPSLLEAALEGLQLQKQRIDTQIQEVKLLLKQRRTDGGSDSGLHHMPRRRELSDAARKRIAAAQRKRWAEYRKTASQNKSGD
jgi:hypothetical protein